LNSETSEKMTEKRKYRYCGALVTIEVEVPDGAKQTDAEYAIRQRMTDMIFDRLTGQPVFEDMNHYRADRT
jgi:hypothetical protein